MSTPSDPTQVPEFETKDIGFGESAEVKGSDEVGHEETDREHEESER